MKYLLTGGSGFIGSHLADLLAKDDNNEIVILDDFSTGNIANLDQLKVNKSVKIVEGSVLDSKIMDELISSVDFVFHLAAAVGVDNIMQNPLHTLQLNIKGTEIALESCSNLDKKLMIFSTSEVYGKNANESFSEEDDRVMGSTSISRWGYAASKEMDEFLSLAYHREKGLNVIVVRLFNTIGPRQASRYGMVVPKFIKKALINEDLQVFGNGLQSRCFCNVSDVVQALKLLSANENAIGEIFNVGNNKEIKIIDLAKKIIKMTNSKSKIRFIPYSDHFGESFEDMLRRKPSIEKLESLTGFSPEKSLDFTLSEIIKYERANFN